MQYPEPIIRSRKIDPEIVALSLKQGAHPVVARILAARPFPASRDIAEIIAPRLMHLDPPNLMADMDAASERIADAVVNRECIGIETDHDCDGQTAHAILQGALTDYFGHPHDKIRSYIGHRIKEGYGLSAALTDRILLDDNRPSLIITADNGSSDEPSIRRLAEAGIDVVVTDHHEVPEEGPPKSALAVVNPTRKGCNYPDPCIAGCMVSWLVAAQTRRVLMERGYLNGNTPSLKDLLDYVAVGTVADCVSIARSRNNRAVVKFGISLIEKGARPCWEVVKPHLPNPFVRSEDLAFKIGPLLNSDGRLSSARGSVDYLLADDVFTARENISKLLEKNERRKKIEKELEEVAMNRALGVFAAGGVSICVLLEEGHPGVHGIVASRVKERFGRPSIMFSPKEGAKELITGSARGVDHFHVRRALQRVSESRPGLMAGFGGHRGAAGLTLQRENFDAFSKAFEIAAREQLSNADVGPVIWTDGFIEPKDLTLGFVDTLKILEPYGREFDSPVFEAVGKILFIRLVGKDKTHAQVTVDIDGGIYKGIWFRIVGKTGDPIPLSIGETVSLIFSLGENHYRNQRTFQLRIIHYRRPADRPGVMQGVQN